MEELLKLLNPNNDLDVEYSDNYTTIHFGDIPHDLLKKHIEKVTKTIILYIKKGKANFIRIDGEKSSTVSVSIYQSKKESDSDGVYICTDSTTKERKKFVDDAEILFLEKGFDVTKKIIIGTIFHWGRRTLPEIYGEIRFRKGDWYGTYYVKQNCAELSNDNSPGYERIGSSKKLFDKIG